MALGFSYTLTPDEQASWTSFQEFAKKISGQQIKINFDFEIKDTAKTIKNPLDSLEKEMDNSGKVLVEKVELIQERLYNTLNNLVIKADKNLLDGILPIDQITQQIQALANSGQTLKQVQTSASQIRLELQQWGQIISNDILLLDNMDRQLANQNETLQVQGSLLEKIQDTMDGTKQKMVTNATAEYEKLIQKQIEGIKTSQAYRSATEAQKTAFENLTSSMKIHAYSVEGVKRQGEELTSQLNAQRQIFEDRYLDEARTRYNDLEGTLKNLVVRYVSLQAVLHNIKFYFQNAVQYIHDLDDAYTDVAVSMDITRQEFNDWTKDARGIAQANGVMTTSLMDMVKIYATAGEDISQIQEKLAGTAMIQNITQWDAEQTTSAVNSIVEQYKLMETEINGVTGDIANAINYLGDNLIAISNALEIDNVKGIQEMVSAIDTSGAIVESAGGSMQWFMGITGGLAESMNATGAEVANAMKMIAARTLQQKQVLEEFNDTGEDTAIVMANAEKALKDVGVSIRNGTTGELRDLEDILGEVAAKWDTLSDTTQQFLGEKLAGNNRRSYFTAMMENYERILELRDAGLNSSGELAKANEERVQSLAGQINILKDKMLAFADSFIPVVDNGVRLANTLLDVVEKVGALPTTLALGTTAFMTFNEKGKEVRDTLMYLGESGNNPFSNMISWANTFITQNKQKIETLKDNIAMKQENIRTTLEDINVRKQQNLAIGDLTTRLKQEQVELNTTRLSLVKTTLATYVLQTAMTMGLSVAIGGTIALVSKFAKEIKNSVPSLDSAQESVQSFSQSIDDYETSIQKAKQAREDIVSVEEIVNQLKNENLSLEKQNESLEEANGLLASHGSNYTSIKSILENENIPLEERVKLLEREAELETEKNAREAYKKVTQADLFGNSLFDKLGNSLDKDMGEYATLVRQMNSQIEGLFGSDELIQKKTEEISSKYNALLKESITDMESFVTQANEGYSSVMKAYDLGVISEEEFNKYKQQYEDLLENLKEWATKNKVSINIATLTVDEESEEAINEKAQLLKEKIASSFNETYENPFSFNSFGDLDKTIDNYQRLYQENEKLIEILNEANAIEIQDGLPISKGFSEILNSNLDDMDNFQSALLTINELFEDMSTTDLTEMFGSDLASQIQEVLNIDLSTPFNEIPDVAQQAVEGVIDSFGTMEDELKDIFYRLNATNEEFYQELQEKNAQVFEALSERWGVSTNDYANVAEYKRAVDQQVYTELMQMDANALNQRYLNTLELLGIKEEAGEERVSMEDQAAFLINGIDVKELKAKLENEKKILEAKKAELEGELKAEESEANNSLDLQDDAGVKSLQMMNELSNRAMSHYNSFYGTMKSTGSLDGVAISATTGRATTNTASLAQGSVTAKAIQNVTDQIAEIDGILADLDAYEKLSSTDLTFNITPYNPSNSSTTSSGGYKPSSSNGSKGSSGSGSSTKKEVENLELVIDRYYELNDAIDDVNNALEMNRQLQDAATTIEQTKKLHKEEIDLLNEKLRALEKLRLEQRNELLDNKNLLTSAGFKFDGDGNISNYASQLKSMQNYANSLSGDAKQAQIDYVNSIVSVIDAYTTLANDTLPSTELSIAELTQEIKDVNKEHEKTLKLVEALGDRYYEINGLINDVDRKLAINQAKQQNATASERVKLMEEEIELMKEKQDLLIQQGKELKTEADELKKKLSEQGVEFNDDGTIKNYKELMDKYKTIASQYVGDSRDEVLNEAEELIDLIEKYDDIIRNSLPDLAIEWEDYTNSIKEAEEAMAKTVTDVQKDITSAIENELTKRTEKVKSELQKQKDAYNKQFEEEDWEDSLNSEQRKLDEIQQQINNLSRDTSLAGQLKLQQLREEYEAQQKVIDDMIRDKEKENGNNRFDEEMENLDQQLEDALDPQNIADLVNKALVDGFVTIGDEVIALDTLMSDWLNETGDGLYAIGDILREELIDNLRVAQELMTGMGIINTGVATTSDTNLTTKSLQQELSTTLSSNKPTQQKVEVAIGSLVEVQGNVVEDVLPQVEAMLDAAKSELIDEIAEELMKR